MLYIDPEECIDCGACIPECPVEAIFTQEEVPEKKSEWVKYIQINADRAKALKNGEKAGTLKTDAGGQPVEGHITAKREDFQRGPERPENWTRDPRRGADDVQTSATGRDAARR
jgi:ferredoxin